jgi:hypothetical protein
MASQEAITRQWLIFSSCWALRTNTERCVSIPQKCISVVGASCRETGGMEARTERRWWRGPTSPTGRRRRRVAYSSRAGRLTRTLFISTKIILLFSVADQVFGPPGSRSDSGGGINLFRNIWYWHMYTVHRQLRKHPFLFSREFHIGWRYRQLCVPCWVRM